MKTIKLLICCLILALLSFKLSAVEQQNFLIINSYHFGYPWSDLETKAVNDVFEKYNPQAEIYLEYMDDKRTGKAFRKDFETLIGKKFKGLNFSAVIALDDPALKLVIAERGRLFSGIPIVFCGVSDFTYDELNKIPNMVGAYEKVELRGTIDFAMRLQPDAKELYIATDGTFNNSLSYEELKKIEPDYAGKLKFIFMDAGLGLTFDEYFSAVKKVPPGQIFLYRGFMIDKAGKSMNNTHVLSATCQYSKSPVYVTKTDELGYGAIGGVLRDGYEHGQYAADTAIEIVKKDGITGIPKIKELSNKSWVDNKILKRFGIPRKNVPPLVKIVNEDESFFRLHYKVIVISVMLLLVQTLIILLLYINVRTRKMAEKSCRSICPTC